MTTKTQCNQYSHYNFLSFGGTVTIFVSFFFITMTTRKDIKDVYLQLNYFIILKLDINVEKDIKC